MKKIISCMLVEDKVVTENSNDARELNSQSVFGTVLKEGKVSLSFIEAMYLLDKEKIVILNQRNKEISFESFLKKARKTEPNIWVRFCVFKDLRDRGYVVKTALKFGADFRVYNRGVKPGEDHAKWVVFPVSEGSTLTWHEFAAKNRVAHSTKKKLLLGIVDDEGDCTYYEVKWTRP